MSSALRIVEAGDLGDRGVALARRTQDLDARKDLAAVATLLRIPDFNDAVVGQDRLRCSHLQDQISGAIRAELLGEAVHLFPLGGIAPVRTQAVEEGELVPQHGVRSAQCVSGDERALAAEHLDATEEMKVRIVDGHSLLEIGHQLRTSSGRQGSLEHSFVFVGRIADPGYHLSSEGHGRREVETISCVEPGV